jgi:hypothetical protein
VRHQEHGAARFAHPSDLIPQEPAAQGIDVVGRLVQDHHPPRPDGDHREADEPLDAARELRADLVPPLADVERLDQLLGAAPDRRAVPAPDLPGE